MFFCHANVERICTWWKVCARIDPLLFPCAHTLVHEQLRMCQPALTDFFTGTLPHSSQEEGRDAINCDSQKVCSPLPRAPFRPVAVGPLTHARAHAMRKARLDVCAHRWLSCKGTTTGRNGWLATFLAPRAVTTAYMFSLMLFPSAPYSHVHVDKHSLGHFISKCRPRMCVVCDST